jgi:hypothetical protein
MVPVAGIRKSLDDELLIACEVHGDAAGSAETSRLDVPLVGVLQQLLPVAIANTPADVADEVFGVGG